MYRQRILTRSCGRLRRIGAGALCLGLAMATAMGGCGIGGLVDAVDNITGKIDSAINKIDINSAEWQEIVRDLIAELPETENDLKADIDEVLQRGIKATTVSAIAAGDFVARRVQEGLDRIKSKFNGEPVPVYPPAFLGFAPEVVTVRRVLDDEVNSIAVYGYDFDRRDPGGKMMELWLLRGGQYVPVSYGLTLATHYEGTINLAGNGVQMSKDCTLFELRWDNKVISTLPILQPDPPQPKNIKVDLSGISYKPPHTRGDKEFKGHGPYIEMEAFLAGANFVPGGATALQARVTMFAEETESDWTTASGSSNWHIVYTAEPGYRILNILSPTYSFASYTDNTHVEDPTPMGAADLVAEYRSTGDTSSDNDAGHATQMRVIFNQVEITVIKDDPYFN